MRHLYSFLLSVLLTTFGVAVHAQYTTVGSASSSSPGVPNATCFQLTPSLLNQAGAVWSNTTVDLSQNFTLNTKLYFGAVDAGADGLAFVLRSPGTPTLGTNGGGIGYWGIFNSFIVEFDTWQNNEGCFSTGDPAGDHLGFMSNGSPFHVQGPPPCNFPSGALLPPTEFATNIEDGQWHDATFSWNATTHTFTVSIFGNTYSFTGDIVNNLLGGNPQAIWGFTAATGAGSGIGNEHGVCIVNAPPPTCGQLVTVTQGGWGAVPHGNNPGTYLYAHFSSVFPSGLTVGSTPNFNVHLTSAQAITNLLPTGGQPKALTQNYTDPTDVKTVLVGQLVALTLNVSFDAADPGFSPSGVPLGDMIIASGTFKGMTVNQFLSIANGVLGGTNTTYTPSQVNDMADAINSGFDGGQSNILTCPPNSVPGSAQRVAVPALQELNDQGFRVWPNPAPGQFSFQLNKNLGGLAQVQISNADGRLIQKRTVPASLGQTINFDLSKQAAGLYLVKVITGKGVQTQRLVVQK
jgi:hypothetical protein